MMSDRSIESLQTKYELKLKKINAQLRQNKLLMNYPKTSFNAITIRNTLANLLVQVLI